MNDDRSLERAARSWLEEGPTRAPDRPVDAALNRIQTTRQERDWIPWRLPTMNPLARLAAVAVLAVVAVGGALYALGGPHFGVGGTPTSSPVVTPTASIEGTWDAEFTHTEMLAAGLADQAEDDPGNYGHFLLAIGGGSFEIRQLDGPQDVGSGTYTTSLGSVTFSFTGGEQESFTMPYSVTATTLTLGTGGPVAFRVEPWRRVAPAIPAGPTPTPTGG